MSLHAADSLASLAMLAAAMVILALQGCVSSPITDEAFGQGWREARVVEIGIADNAFLDVKRDCRQLLHNDKARRYALVAYRDGGRHFVRYVGLAPQDVDIRHAHVYKVNINDCKAPWHRLQ